MSLSISEAFGKYKNAVIDASFFDSGIRADVWEELKKLKIWRPKTFSVECDAYSKLIKDKYKLEIYRQLIARMKSELNIREIEASRAELSQNVGFKLHNDTFGFVRFISSQFPGQAVILTANAILKERIILNELAVDIYDLNTNTLLPNSDFSALKQKYTVCSPSSPIVVEQPIKEGLVLTTGKNRVILGRVFNSGGAEGKIFRLCDSESNEFEGVLAKVLHSHKRTYERAKNISDLKEFSDKGACDWATMPLEVLYIPETMRPIGYVMKFIKNPRVLGASAQYAGDLSDPDCNLNQRISETIDLCVKIARQILFLNHYGILTFDFNTDNFVFPADPDGEMIIWDTDSLGYNSYISNASAPSSSITRVYDLQKKNDCIQYSYDKLYQGIFNLLSLGDNPLDEDTREYRYLDPNYHSHFRRAFIPERVLQLFDDVFYREYPFSPEELLFELVTASESLKRIPANDKTYAELCDIGPDEEDGEEDPPYVGDLSESKDKSTKLPIAVAIIAAVILLLIGFIASNHITEDVHTEQYEEEITLTETEIEYE